MDNSNFFKIVVFIILLAIIGFYKISNRPKPSSENFKGINVSEGLILSPPINTSPIPKKEGQLISMLPEKDFRCSGRVFVKKKNRQPGFDYSLSIVSGKLANLEVFDYLNLDGHMDKEFSDGFVLTKKYFQANSFTVYLSAANKNLKNAIGTLKEKDKVRIEGHLVFMNTERGIIKTSLDPKEFKCKYGYLRKLVTEDSVFE